MRISTIYIKSHIYTVLLDYFRIRNHYISPMQRGAQWGYICANVYSFIVMWFNATFTLGYIHVIKSALLHEMYNCYKLQI